MPTIAALHERGEAIVRQVLAENAGRWEALTDADRERLELLAATIVKRLLHQPILRLKARGDEQRTYAYVQALRELFGLEERARCPRSTRRPPSWAAATALPARRPSRRSAARAGASGPERTAADRHARQRARARPGAERSRTRCAPRARARSSSCRS